MKDYSAEQVLDTCVLSNPDDAGAVQWLKYLVNGDYERKAEITAAQLNKLLLQIFCQQRLSRARIDALLQLGANPGEPVVLEDGTIEPIMKLLQRLHNQDENIEQTSKLLYLMVHAVRRENTFSIVPNEKIEQALRRSRFIKQRNYDLLRRIGLALSQFGESQSIEAFERHWNTWGAICESLGVNVKNLRRLVYPLIKVEQDAHSRESHAYFRNLDPLHRFAVACATASFTHYLAQSVSLQEVYDIDAFCESGDITKSLPEKKVDDALNAQDIKASLNNFARARVELAELRMKK